MYGIFDFVYHHRVASIVMLLLNLTLARKMFYKMEVHLNRFARDALGRRDRIKETTIYSKTRARFNKYLKLIINNKNNRLFNAILSNSRLKVKQAGLKKPCAIYLYAFFQYINPLIGLILVVVIRKRFLLALFFGGFLYGICQYYIHYNKKKMLRKFEKHTYIIYKYLNNQISSGMRVIDAIKSVYLIVSDKDIRIALISLASHFELTNDIEGCLEDFKQNFQCEAAETLAVALKQGIETGDSSKIIARQEKKMFQRFIYQIKLETDMAKFRSFYAIAMFCIIISIMVAIPLICEVKNSLSQILVN